MPDAERFTLPDLSSLSPAVDFWSVRFVEESCESFTVRKDVALPPAATTDRGAMVTVHAGGGSGYAATGDTSAAGLREALDRAAQWARATPKFALVDPKALPRSAARGEYASPSLASPSRSRRDWFELLMRESRSAAIDPRIVDWEATMEVRHATHRLVTSEGGDLVQRFRFLFPGMAVTAHADGDTQTRTLYGYRGLCQQGGEEILARFGYEGAARRLADEALELLAAPNCPTGTMDVLLMPDQMILQIHESIGHPLELDRILGDERNFAGTSFVTPDMFGSYRYGSELLNVTFDPTVSEELGSYGWDDDGTKAEKVHLIRNGILERPLGGTFSQARAGLPGVSNARADGWNRPPIDRMATSSPATRRSPRCSRESSAAC
jgi:predicted Zn-dependent protease